jgi:hypothetical protein
MNDERLYLNGKQVDLSPSTIIAKTLQVNDIGSIESRQSNFTRNIALPITPKNMSIMNYLGVVGNESTIPYEKLTCNYLVGNDSVIHNGWAVVNETTNTFNFTIYDGIIDFFKVIENKNFDELSLSGLTHDKTLSSVLNSWSGATPYKYIIADYNGRATYSATTGHDINIDYLIPSVQVSYLWEQTFSHFGYTYTGSIFESDDFNSLWLTYPKGITSAEDTVIFESEETNFTANGYPLQNYPNTRKSSYLTPSSWATNDLASINNNKHFHVPETGNYRIELAGEIHSYTYIYFSTSDIYAAFPIKVDIWLGKNADTLNNPDSIIPIRKLAADIGSTSSTAGESFSYNGLIELEANESICIFARSSNGYNNILYIEEDAPVTLTLSKVQTSSINFDNALEDFPIKQLITDVVNRFGLTIFPDKETNTLDFLTLEERLSNAGVVNWTTNFQTLKSERYAYGTYAQNNWFRYSYNDTNADYKDGVISIANVNLEASRDVLQSKFYAPLKDMTNQFAFPTNVYMLWEKETSEEDGEQVISYKPLERRFHLIRSVDRTFSSRHIGSEQLATSATITSAPFESFVGLSFGDVVQNYYPTIKNILDRAKLTIAVMYLTPQDVGNFDFRKIYFIEQLGGYFLVNKISNWIANRLCDVELIKVEYQPESNVSSDEPTDTITITGYFLTDVGGGDVQVEIFYTTTLTDTDFKARFIHPLGDVMTNSSPLVFTIPDYQLPHSCKIQNLDGTIDSNTITVFSENIE